MIKERYEIETSIWFSVFFIHWAGLAFYICCVVFLNFISVHCAKKSSPSVDSSLFIARLWNRGLVSVGFSKPSSVPRQTAKRQQYQRLADVPISVFEMCTAQINTTGPVSNFSCRLLYCIALRMSTRIPLSFSFNKLYVYNWDVVKQANKLNLIYDFHVFMYDFHIFITSSLNWTFLM